MIQDDQDTGDALIALRNQTNLVLEQARNQKLLGSALEAKVLLHVADPGLADELQKLNESSDGADPLRYAFITSQAELVQQPVSSPCGFPALSVAVAILASHITFGPTNCCRQIHLCKPLVL